MEAFTRNFEYLVKAFYWSLEGLYLEGLLKDFLMLLKTIFKASRSSSRPFKGLLKGLSEDLSRAFKGLHEGLPENFRKPFAGLSAGVSRLFDMVLKTF